MGIPDFQREPDALSLQEAAEACASDAALRHLEALDEEFVDRALSLGADSGEVLDVSTGSGQIAIKLALRNPCLIVHGIETSDALLRRAARDAGQWGVDMRVLFNYGDAGRIPYDDGLFELVLCDSGLRRAPDPARVLREMARVCKPSGALLLRDLRRPGRLLYRYHVRRHGKNYQGRMKALFEASVRSACSLEEFKDLVRQSGVPGLEVLRMGPAHLGCQRRKT